MTLIYRSLKLLTVINNHLALQSDFLIYHIVRALLMRFGRSWCLRFVN